MYVRVCIGVDCSVFIANIFRKRELPEFGFLTLPANLKTETTVYENIESNIFRKLITTIFADARYTARRRRNIRETNPRRVRSVQR